MNPAEFLLDLANGNLNDVSVPGELKDRVQVGSSDRGIKNRKPSPAVVHEVNIFTCTIKNHEHYNIVLLRDCHF